MFYLINLFLTFFINAKKVIIHKLQNIKGIKIYRTIISIIMSFSFLFMSIFYQPLTVYASGEQWTASEKIRFFGEGFFNILSDVVGVLFPTGSDGRDLKEDYENYVLNNDWIQDNMTYDEWVAANLGINYQSGDSGNSDVSYSVDLQNSLIDWANDWINENTGFVYVYSQSAGQFLSSFDNGDKYHAFLSFVDSHDDKIIVTLDGSANAIAVYDDVSSFVYYSSSTDYYSVYKYKSDWSRITTGTRYVWDSNSLSYVESSTASNHATYVRKSPNSNFISYYLIIDLNTTQYMMYKTYDAMRYGTEGVQQYYITDSYKTEHVSNVKNTTTNNINNSISYNNVQNWVNNYYVQNTSYPSSNDVYNYINNYEGSGGGSGGGSGSGSDDDDDDDGWDWGFLDTIAGFFKGLLKALKTALEGILDLLTGVIDLFIGEEQPDGTRSGGIPTIIGKLVAHFLPMLPDWCTQLIGFSVLLSLILGIVKLIRGH